MLIRTHLVIAVLILLFVPFNLLFVVGFLLATVFVDIDAKKSKIGNHWYLRPIQWLTRHRGAFHSLLFAILISAVLYYVNLPFSEGFFFGYLLHLGLDCLTSMGCRLFWPISNFKISFFIRSGGLLEEIIFVIVLLADILIFFQKLY